MAGERAQIVGAAVTHVGKVREHNEDAHFLDADLGLFVVCDGMGGHAAGEVASALAIRTIRSRWSGEETLKIADYWLGKGTHEAKKALLAIIRAGVVAAHDAILDEASRDETKKGMGTTLVGAMIVGGDVVFAHAGDSRAYLVRDHIAMQLTEDHTLLARLTAAGIDVDVDGEGSRFKSMLTNALGIGVECRIATFIVPLADGDRFLLCSDGISEYITEAEVGEVLTKQPSPARAAQKLVELALERGGGDNATALVVRVLEAGETPQPAELRKKDDDAIKSCLLWTAKVTPQQRLRALRIAMPRDWVVDDKLPALTLGDRVAWIIVDGEVEVDGKRLGPGALLYPECLVDGSHTPERDGLATAKSDVRALALRSDDFRELCDDDAELGEALLEGLAALIASKQSTKVSRRIGRPEVDARSATDPSLATIQRPAPPVVEPPPLARQTGEVRAVNPPGGGPSRPATGPRLAEATPISRPSSAPRLAEATPISRPSSAPKLAEATPISRPSSAPKLAEATPISRPPSGPRPSDSKPPPLSRPPLPPLRPPLGPPPSDGKPILPKPIPKLPEAKPPTEVTVTKLGEAMSEARLDGSRSPAKSAPQPSTLGPAVKPAPPRWATDLDTRTEPGIGSAAKLELNPRPAGRPLPAGAGRGASPADEPTGPRAPIARKSTEDELVQDDSGVAVLIVAGPPIDSSSVSASPLVESLLNLVETGPDLELSNDLLNLPPPRFGRAMTADPHIETYELDPDPAARSTTVTSMQPEFEEEPIEPVSVEVDAVTMVRTLPVFNDESRDALDDDESPLPGDTTQVVKPQLEASGEDNEAASNGDEGDHVAKHTPITSEDTSVASGTISTPDRGPRRAKRLTDGWNDD